MDCPPRLITHASMKSYLEIPFPPPLQSIKGLVAFGAPWEARRGVMDKIQVNKPVAVTWVDKDHLCI